MTNEKIYIEEVRFFNKISLNHNSIDNNIISFIKGSGGFCSYNYFEKKNRAGGVLCSNFLPGGIGCFGHYNGIVCAGVMGGVGCLGVIGGFICNSGMGGIGCNSGVGGFACNIERFGGFGCNISS